MIKALYKLTRINEYWGSSALLSFLGIFIASQEQFPALDKIIFILIANLFSFIFSFAINDVEDAEDDAYDVKKALRNPISAKLITKRTAYIYCIIAFSLSLVFYAACGYYSVIFGLLTLVLGFLYSWKRVRLKSIPILDVISHAFFLATLPFLAAAFVATSTPMVIPTLFLASLLFIFSATEDLRNEFRDFDNDKLAKLKNTVQILNIAKFQKEIHIFSFIPLFIIYLYMFLTVASNQRVAMLVITIATITHVVIYARTHKTGTHEYPYMQFIFSLLGVILILK